jgi:DNA mismatch repair protein MutS
MAELTPMMQQYREVKARNPDCILFFRLGDFYEMFEQDAVLVSKELDLTLTSRDHSKDKDQDEKIPMCGVPFHSSESYVARLVAKGYKVAICEQMEDPALAKGLVKRDIIRIVTPGTVTESSMLEESKNNYYACVYADAAGFGLAFCDISTGAFSATMTTGEDAAEAAANELGSFSPAEVLLGGAAAEDPVIKEVLQERLGCCVNRGDEQQFDCDLCQAALTEQLGRRPDELGLAGAAPAAIAAGALLQQLRESQKNDLPHIRELEYYLPGKFMGSISRRGAISSSSRPCARRKSAGACSGSWTRPKPPWAGGCCARGWSARF